MIGKPWAVFDVDGTLLPGRSMERVFIQEGIRRGILSPKHLVQFAAYAFREGCRGSHVRAFKQNKYYLKKMPTEMIANLAETVFQEKIIALLSADSQAIVAELRRADYQILLMTGAPDFLANHLRNIYQPDALISTRLEKSGPLYSGKIAGIHPYGQAKRLLLLKAKDRLDIDFAHSAAFANHHTDIAHLQLFSRAVAVNPTVKLRKSATLRNWEIVYWQ